MVFVYMGLDASFQWAGLLFDCNYGSAIFAAIAQNKT